MLTINHSSRSIVGFYRQTNDAGKTERVHVGEHYGTSKNQLVQFMYSAGYFMKEAGANQIKHIILEEPAESVIE